jgi:hypothetical protein
MNGIKLGELLKGTFAVPIGLAVVLVPFSMLIGWNLITLILFWFLIIPGLTIYLPTKTSNNKNHLLESGAGLMIFYWIMVFMIYEHYKSDYFQIMISSCVINLLVVIMATIPFALKPHKQLGG